MISKEEYDLIRGSWIKAMTRSESLGAIFYGKLFARYPHLRELFKVSKEEQARKLTFVLTIVFTKLNKMGDIENEVNGLALRHIRYGVKPSHFHIFGKVLLDTLSIVLEEEWTNEYRSVWEKMYTIISDAMVKAIKEEEDLTGIMS